MSEGVEKKFVNAGVQSSSEFGVALDESSSKLVYQGNTDELSPRSRVDSTVQTQDSANELKPTANRSQKTLLITLESCDRHEEDKPENSNFQKLKKSKTKYNKKGMENNPSDKGPKPLTLDLERKKLEAELKATEQIAKIRQSVIEKRLELELASLQDPSNPNARPQSPNQNLKIFDSGLERNENLAEQTGQAYRNPLLPPTVSSASPTIFSQGPRFPFQTPFPPPVSPPNQFSRDYPKTKISKNENDFSIKNEIRALKLSPLSTGSPEPKYQRSGNVERSIRNIILPERGRFMQTIEKPTYSSLPPGTGGNPFSAHMEQPKYAQAPQVSPQEAYYAGGFPQRNGGHQQDLEEPGCSPGLVDPSATSIWKVLMTKVKKKMKRTSPPWQ